MIEINTNANQILYGIVARYIGNVRTYGSPLIHYWYRNVVEAVRLIDNGFNKEEGCYRESLENSLGDVDFFVKYMRGTAVYIITNFVFNYATISQYLNRPYVRTAQSTRPTLPLFNSPSSQPLKCKSIGMGIICCQYADGHIQLLWKGKNIALASQFDKIEKPFYHYRDGNYAIGIKDNVRYKLFPNDTIQRINENKQSKIRLTKTQFKKLLIECITKIINEIA